jgi:hypothetical protein
MQDRINQVDENSLAPHGAGPGERVEAVEATVALKRRTKLSL